MSHKHYCIGKCGAYVTCHARVIRDDCGAHCEREEDPDEGQYECEDCHADRLEAEREQDDLAERCGDDVAI